MLELARRSSDRVADELVNASATSLFPEPQPFGTSDLLFQSAVGVTAASWAFFLGPLARALGQRTLGNRVNLVGALFAAPAYSALPLLLVLQ